MTKIKIFNLVVLIIVISFHLSFCSTSGKRGERNKYLILKNKKEIEGGNFKGKIYKFTNISDMCFDDNDNLYIADSRENKIFQISASGLISNIYGRQGQGPGEFLGCPGRFKLYLSYGNNNRLFITDMGNRKISVYARSGTHLKDIKLPAFVYDSPIIDSSGNMFLLSLDGEYVVKKYSADLKWVDSCLNINYHIDFPYYSVKNKSIDFYINNSSVQKKIKKNDEFFIFSNLSLTAFYYNDNLELLNSFRINNTHLLKDFKKALKKAVKNNAFIFPFKVFLDHEENLCLLYFNREMSKIEIYRYTSKGDLIEILVIPENIHRIIDIEVSSNGDFFIALDAARISILNIKEVRYDI